MIPFLPDPYSASLLLVAGFYLLGSVPFAVVWSKAFGLPDPRTYGSGNPGASNVARSGSRTASALTFACDALKGAAVFAPKALGVGDASFWCVLGLAAVVGHMFPVFLKFRGGKGVATVFGVLLALDWLSFALAAAVWILLFACLRISAVASLSAVAAAGAVLAMPWQTDLLAPAYVLLVALVAFRHKDNVIRLLNRSENRFT